VAPRKDSTSISPTAHYTGQVWVDAGLADPALGTGLGRLFRATLEPMLRPVSRLSSGLSLEAYLVGRHRAIDAVVGGAVESGRLRQVVEVGAGLSPRGIRFARMYRGSGLTYVEADLPAMARIKRARLAEAGLHEEGHRVVDVDILRPGGPMALEGLLDSLDPTQGTAIVAEGLLAYFDRATVEGLLRRVASALGRFPEGLFVASLEIGSEAGRFVAARALVLGLRVFTRGGVHLLYRTAAEARAALEGAGFDRSVLHRPSDLLGPGDAPEVVRIAEAWVRGV
jgi:O-methyltransferase involved in polyketide biosynthesis